MAWSRIHALQPHARAVAMHAALGGAHFADRRQVTITAGSASAAQPVERLARGVLAGPRRVTPHDRARIGQRARRGGPLTAALGCGRPKAVEAPAAVALPEKDGHGGADD